MDIQISTHFAILKTKQVVKQFNYSTSIYCVLRRCQVPNITDKSLCLCVSYILTGKNKQ